MVLDALGEIVLEGVSVCEFHYNENEVLCFLELLELDDVWMFQSVEYLGFLSDELEFSSAEVFLFDDLNSSSPTLIAHFSPLFLSTPANTTP